MKTTASRKSVFTSMYAALICVTGFIVVPLGPLPLTLQNAVAIAGGLILGLPQGAASVGIFLAVGAMGLPVFSGARGGMAILQGPTGGFLTGYFVGALVAGCIAGPPAPDEKKGSRGRLLRLCSSALAGITISYLIGLLQFKSYFSLSFTQALNTCIAPFLLPDIIKFCILVPLAARIRPTIARIMENDAPTPNQG